MSNQQTDNDKIGFSYKVSLRLHSLKKINHNILVLDCFAGNQFLWSEVKKQSSLNIETVPIDIRPDKSKAYLKGMNLKFMKTMDLTQFDIIDLDAYGIPFDHLELLFEKKYKGTVHVTFIQSNRGRLPNKFLNKLGYTNEMIKKIPTLFSKNAFEKLCNYLKMNGISHIFYLSLKRKYYLYFKI